MLPHAIHPGDQLCINTQASDMYSVCTYIHESASMSLKHDLLSIIDSDITNVDGLGSVDKHYLNPNSAHMTPAVTYNLVDEKQNIIFNNIAGFPGTNSPEYAKTDSLGNPIGAFNLLGGSIFSLFYGQYNNRPSMWFGVKGFCTQGNAPMTTIYTDPKVTLAQLFNSKDLLNYNLSY